MCDFTLRKRDWQYSNTTIVVILHQNNANFTHLNLKICNSKNIINKRFRILSTQTIGGRFLVIFSLTDAMKYQMHPRRVSGHLCKLKIPGFEELNPLSTSEYWSRQTELLKRETNAQRQRPVTQWSEGGMRSASEKMGDNWCVVLTGGGTSSL